MKTFEYKVEIVSRYNASNFKVETDLDLLTKLGLDRWELVSTVLMGQIIYGYFKRDTKKHLKPSDSSIQKT
jgi:hypothetical protein